MAWLIFGVLLFTVAHLGKTLLTGPRAALAGAIGDGPVKGVVALLLVLSIWLMARGWSSADVSVLWSLPLWMNHVIVLLMLPAFILFFGSHPGSALRARIRHPQLTGFKLWAVLHLLANGDTRSLVLFGGLLAWAVLELILINRRDGKPPLPAAADSPMKAWLAVPIGIVAWLGLLLAHQWLFGVSPLG